MNEDKILIVDDEVEIAKLLATVLKKEGFTNILLAHTVKDAIDVFEEENPDMVVLDIMLPDGEGYDVCKHIRKTSRIPILFLSAKSEEIDRILGFAIGGDDYVTKPFSPKEVAYRIKAQLRRYGYMNEVSEKEKNTVIKAGPFELDEDKAEFRKNGELIELKPKELKLFSYLASNKNQIISKEKICDRVWGEDYIGFDNTIMVHVRRLREKIEDNPSKPEYLINVKGLGYKLVIKGD